MTVVGVGVGLRAHDVILEGLDGDAAGRGVLEGVGGPHRQLGPFEGTIVLADAVPGGIGDIIRRGEGGLSTARGDGYEFLVLHLLLGEVGALDGARRLTAIVGRGGGTAHLDIVVDGGLGVDTTGQEGVGVAAAEEYLVAAGGVDTFPLYRCLARRKLFLWRVVVGQVAFSGIAPAVGARTGVGDGAVTVFVDGGILGHDAGCGFIGVGVREVGGVEDGAARGHIGQRHLAQADAVELTAQGLSVGIFLGHLPLEVVFGGRVVEAYVVLVEGGTVPDEGTVVGVVDGLHGCGV